MPDSRPKASELKTLIQRQLSPPEYVATQIAQLITTTTAPRGENTDVSFPPWYTMEEVISAIPQMIQQASRERNHVTLATAKTALENVRKRRIDRARPSRPATQMPLPERRLTREERERLQVRNAAGYRILQALMAGQTPDLDTPLAREMHEVIKPNFDIGRQQARERRERGS